MKCLNLHPWDISYDKAINIQQSLSSQITLEPLNSPVELVAGADVSYSKGSNTFYSGVVILRLSDMSIIEEATAEGNVDFPYIPGLLSFRESPVLIKAFEKIKITPDAVIFDGQGIAHPRSLGIASHLGLILDIPSIGCAKNILVGEYNNLGDEFGEYSLMMYKNKAVGAAVRTKKKVSPVFVSPGHKIDIESSINTILRVCRGYRLPEPTRQAHILVNKSRVSFGG